MRWTFTRFTKYFRTLIATHDFCIFGYVTTACAIGIDTFTFHFNLLLLGLFLKKMLRVVALQWFKLTEMRHELGLENLLFESVETLVAHSLLLDRKRAGKSPAWKTKFSSPDTRFLCNQQTCARVGPATRFDRDFDVVPEKHKKAQEPVNGKT
jgi:hypothetical protein